MEHLRVFSLVLVVLGSVALAVSASGACIEVECLDHHAAGSRVLRFVQADGVLTRAAASLMAGAVALMALAACAFPSVRRAHLFAHPARGLLVAGVPLRV